MASRKVQDKNFFKNQTKTMFLGNEKDCICAKQDGRHKKFCDAYRLGQFLGKIGAAVKYQGYKVIHMTPGAERDKI